MIGVVEVPGGVDERNVGEYLRKIAALAFQIGIELFSEQSHIVSQCEHPFEQLLELPYAGPASAGPVQASSCRR